MPSPASPLWLLIQALEDVVEEITTDNGARTDIGTTVNVEPAQDQAESAPRTVIAVQSYAVTSVANQLRGRNVALVIEVAIPATAANAKETAAKALDDLVDAFPAIRKYTLADGLTAQVEAADGRLLDRPDGIDVVLVQAAIKATMRERLA